MSLPATDRRSARRTRRNASSPPRHSVRRDAHRPLPEADAGLDPHDRGGRVLFEVPFTSAMGDAQLSALGHLLDLWTHMDPKMHSDPNGPGVARLDHFSGLFLERAAGDDRWRLRARTWGNPTPGTVHGWHLVAAQAARQLDPDVTLPGPMAGAQDDSPGAAADRADGEGEGRARRRATGRA